MVATMAVSGRKLEAKDGLNLAMSAIALLVSGFTAYFSFLRVTDDLRVVMQESPYFEVDRATSKLELRGNIVMLLMNAGSRPLAVTSLRLAVPFHQRCDSDTRYTVAAYIELQMRPLVLKEKDVVTLTPEPSKREINVRDYVGSGDTNASLCLVGTVATMTEANAVRALTLGTIDISELGASTFAFRLGPWQLYKRSGTVFDSY
jgi:hypothetical protein